MNLVAVYSERAKVLGRLFRNYHGAGFCVRLPGSSWNLGEATRPAFALTLKECRCLSLFACFSF
jgi:hypothetical protein